MDCMVKFTTVDFDVAFDFIPSPQSIYGIVHNN